MRLITLILLLICTLTHKDHNTETHQHPDPNLSEIKGFHYHEDLTNDSFWNPEEFKNIWEKLGFTNKESISSEDFRKALYHLIGFEDISKLPNAIKIIFDKFLKDLPDKLNNTDLNKYFNVDKFFNSIREYYNERNQPSYYEQLMSKFKKSWSNATDLFKYMFTNENSFCCNETDFNEVIKSLDIEHKKRLDKSDIERIVKNLLTSKDAHYPMPQPVRQIINQIIDTLPNDLHIDELRLQLSYGKIMPIVKKVANETCGDSCFDKHKEDFDKGDIKNIFKDVFNYTYKHPEDL
jgi:hypothetical protein